jgi:hypothetical protein
MCCECSVPCLLPGADIILTDLALPDEDSVWLLERINKAAQADPGDCDERLGREPGAAAGDGALRPEVTRAPRLRAGLCRDRGGSGRSSVIQLDCRGRRLRAALAAVFVRGNAPELRLVRAWLNNWSGLGLLVVGMTYQGWDLQLTAYAARDWQATFFPVGIAHSIVGGSAWEPTTWWAVQRAAGHPLRRGLMMKWCMG